ncbi:phosphate/phosphite/phosphonate ABC transporter substrate-binding protein [Acidocella sp.]|jgi:phosphonate transport system substrate-binding protein|uniref:phosphate/phosphite/phosphonate ABC transporter substrate-binding protein n=1 Tax=Acidocella sp. TaxID=50710 RepID=UPI002F3EB291
MKKFALAALGLAFAASATPALAANYCPAGGAIRFGVEPFESNAVLTPIYAKVGALISAEVGCPVHIYIATSYNAEIEAMRAGKLEMGQFGPLGYVLAHQVADAQAIATVADANGNPSTYTASIATWPGSGITTLAQVKGHTFGYSDPASTSGHLFPAYALAAAGIDPNKGVTPLYSGSHTASYEALLNHKVQAGEMNSQVVNAATLAGQYDPKNFVVLWQSKPIPLDPIAVYGKMNPVLKARLITALQHLKLTTLTPAEQKVLGTPSGELVPQNDASYDQIRSLVSVLHINLSKLS